MVACCSGAVKREYIESNKKNKELFAKLHSLKNKYEELVQEYNNLLLQGSQVHMIEHFFDYLVNTVKETKNVHHCI